MFLLNGKRISIDNQYTVGNTVYGNLRDPYIRLSLGVIEVPDPVRPDDRYYWVSENEDGSITSNPKDLDVLKKSAVAKTYSACASMLLPTDHAIVRQIEIPTEKVYPKTLEYRAAVRAAAADAVKAINAATDIASLIDAETVKWPEL